LSAGTAWEAGRLGSRRGPQRLLFGRMHEDVEIERGAFRGRGRIFCIASAGDTAMTLAKEHEVVACDINPLQLAYAEERSRGAARRRGDAERAMNYARTLMPLAGWRRGVVREFLSLSEVGEQLDFWRKDLNTLRFRMGFDLLLSHPVLGVVYSPRLLALVSRGFGAAVRGRLERGFACHPNSANPYAHALLLGEVAEEPGNGGATAEGRLQFALGDAASVLESFAPGYFEGFALSNILDGAEASYCERLERAVRRAGTKDAVVVLRSFAEPTLLLTPNYAGRDRALLWGLVTIQDVNAPL